MCAVAARGASEGRRPRRDVASLSRRLAPDCAVKSFPRPGWSSFEGSSGGDGAMMSQNPAASPHSGGRRGLRRPKTPQIATSRTRRSALWVLTRARTAIKSGHRPSTTAKSTTRGLRGRAAEANRHKALRRGEIQAGYCIHGSRLFFFARLIWRAAAPVTRQ